MEPEVRDFLKRVSITIFAGLLWLIINMTIGIFFGWLFIYDRINTGNIIFYLWLLLSLSGLILLYLKIWKNRLD